MTAARPTPGSAPVRGAGPASPSDRRSTPRCWPSWPRRSTRRGPGPESVTPRSTGPAAGVAVQRAVVVEAGLRPPGASLGLTGPAGSDRRARPGGASASVSRSSMMWPISKSLGV